MRSNGSMCQGVRTNLSVPAQMRLTASQFAPSRTSQGGVRLSSARQSTSGGCFTSPDDAVLTHFPGTAPLVDVAAAHEGDAAGPLPHAVGEHQAGAALEPQRVGQAR